MEIFNFNRRLSLTGVCYFIYTHIGCLFIFLQQTVKNELGEQKTVIKISNFRDYSIIRAGTTDPKKI